MRELRRPAVGFSLVELLLVLTLLAAAAGLVAPRLVQWIEGAQQRHVLQAMRSVVMAWPQKAFLERQALLIDAESAPTHGLTAPQGWALEFRPALRYEPNGMTAGGVVVVTAQGRTVARWRVMPPAGDLHADAP